MNGQLPPGVVTESEEEIPVTTAMFANIGLGVVAMSAPVANKPFLPVAFRRLTMWGSLNFPVYVVMVKDGSVYIRTGRITKLPDTKVGVPKSVTIQFDVWDNFTLSATGDIEVGDPHLFLITEIGLLQFPMLAEVWFGSMYPPEIIAKIREAAKEIRFPATLTAEPEGQNWRED